jgi:hypothetical protein
MRSELFLSVHRLRRRLQNPMSQNPTGSHQDLGMVRKSSEEVWQNHTSNQLLKISF